MVGICVLPYFLKSDLSDLKVICVVACFRRRLRQSDHFDHFFSNIVVKIRTGRLNFSSKSEKKVICLSLPVYVENGPKKQIT